MRTVVKKISVILMAAVMCISSIGVANAQTVTKYLNTGTAYDVHTLTTTKIGDKAKKINTPGINKTSNTSGSIVVSTTKSYTFSASTTISSEFSAGFATVSAAVEVGASYTTEVSAGTTINLESSAPNGVYYAYLCVPHVKASYKVQHCTWSYSGWYTKYTKDISYMPMVDMEYLDLRRVY